MTAVSQPASRLLPDRPVLARAVETGSRRPKWYHTEVPRKVMKELSSARTAPMRDTILWIALHVLTAGAASISVGHLVGGALLDRLRRAVRLRCDTRWHEAGPTARRSAPAG
jgi:fatty acid desaturase